MDDLWTATLRHLTEGNFTALEEHLGGPEGFDLQIAEWHRDGKFSDHPALLAEALSCACMLGRTRTAAYLLDNGVDPYAGMMTGLAGPHYAASAARLDVIQMLVDRGVPLEVENNYGGTVLSQALWSAVFEPKSDHAAVIDVLLQAGARTQKGTRRWWQDQELTKVRKDEIDAILARHRVE